MVFPVFALLLDFVSGLYTKLVHLSKRSPKSKSRRNLSLLICKHANSGDLTFDIRSHALALRSFITSRTSLDNRLASLFLRILLETKLYVAPSSWRISDIARLYLNQFAWVFHPLLNTLFSRSTSLRSINQFNSWPFTFLAILHFTDIIIILHKRRILLFAHSLSSERRLRYRRHHIISIMFSRIVHSSVEVGRGVVAAAGCGGRGGEGGEGEEGQEFHWFIVI